MAYIPPHLRVSDQDNKPKLTPATIFAQTPNFANSTSTTSPYIPPHLRPPASSSSRPVPAASSSSQHHLPYSSCLAFTRHPHFPFGTSLDVIYRFIILPHPEHVSCQHVKFAKFEGDPIPHLEHLQLYRLTADHDSGQQNSTEVNEPIQRNPVNVILQSFKEDLKKVIDKFGRYLAHAETASLDRMVPSIFLRFGRNVFHDRRGYFDWASSYSPENLERNVKTKRLSKTFDDNLCRDDFIFLQKSARKDALHIKVSEEMKIRVEDEMRPGSDFLFRYKLSEHNEESVNPSKTGVEGKLRRLVYPIRHMMGDVACVGKSRDIRLAFQMEIEKKLPELTELELSDLKSLRLALQMEIEKKLPELTELELSDLKSSFSTGKSSLHWPLDGKHSTSGRFKVVRCSHRITTVVIGGGLKWSLLSRGGLYNVIVTPIICKEFCEGHKEWNTEMVFLSIEELLQRAWADCL